MPFCELQLNLHMSLWEFLKFFIAGTFENLKESKCSMSKPVYFPVDDDWHVLDSIETLPSKLLVALPNIFFFLPADKSIVCFTQLSAIRLSSNRLRIRSKRLCPQGSWERSTEKLSFFIMNYKHTCKPTDEIWGQLCKTARWHYVKHRHARHARVIFLCEVSEIGAFM